MLLLHFRHKKIEMKAAEPTAKTAVTLQPTTMNLQIQMNPSIGLETHKVIIASLSSSSDPSFDLLIPKKPSKKSRA